MSSMTSAADTMILPGTGIATSRVGFGCGRLMRVTSAAQRARLLGAAFDEGVRHFDVARMYGLGAAERELGTFLRGRRDQVSVATKFGIQTHAAVSTFAALQSVARRLIRKLPLARAALRRSSRLLYAPKDFSAKAAEASLNASLRELGTDYVDILLLHEPTPRDGVDEELYAYLDSARQAGKIRTFGLSGELGDIMAVERALPIRTPVIQFASDVFKNDAMQIGSKADRATIRFGAIDQALDLVLRTVARDRGRRESLKRQFGVDASQRGAVARLLFWHTVHRNGHGVSLFSASTPERLRELLAGGVDAASTERFARLVCREGEP